MTDETRISRDFAAKRGDLVVVEYKKDYGSREPVYELELVDGVGRDGLVSRTIRHSFGRDHEPEPFYRNSTSMGHKIRRYRCYSNGTTKLVPRSAVDVIAAWAACASRDAEHEWAPMEFASLDAVREFLAPFRSLVAA